MLLQDQFNQFLADIELGDKQIERINSASSTLSEYLAEYYDLSSGDIFLQGSFPNGTAVKPPPEVKEGEYDVDIVAICARDSDSPNMALDNLEKALSANGNYESRIERKNRKSPCVRLRYADEEVGGFHVDVVPARHSHISGVEIEVPKRDKGWTSSSPQAFTQWCQSQGANYSRTVMMLKRWRDINQDGRRGIKSIVLQVLVGMLMQQGNSDAERIVRTLSAINYFLNQFPDEPPVITNPVLPSENLAQSWPIESYLDFKKHVAEALDLAKVALEEPNASISTHLWRNLFGRSFPKPSQVSDSDGYPLGDTSHAAPLFSMGWSERLDTRFSISITASVYKANGNRADIPSIQSNDRALLSGAKILYEALVKEPIPGEIYWQVVNTGQHAWFKQGLRGQFFKAKKQSGGLSDREDRNWEDTAYTGKHWIEAFYVIDNTCVARSGKFFVNVINPRYKTWGFGKRV